MKKILMSILFLFVFLTATNAFSAYIPVSVHATTEDNCNDGELLAYKVKDLINNHDEMYLVPTDSKDPHMVIILSILELDNNSIVYSMVYLVYTVSGRPVYNFLESGVGICTDDRINYEAKDIVDKTLELFDQLSKEINEKQ
ncbi:hypothetical protein [Acinetobacter sp.]|uniref:hypothetical protein n=1 Tax=Acinetobacter sp. TaxID=472 RepID=UPI003D03B41E